MVNSRVHHLSEAIAGRAPPRRLVKISNVLKDTMSSRHLNASVRTAGEERSTFLTADVAERSHKP